MAVTGDGGFGQYLAEFTTAVKYGMPITHVLLDNQELGKIAKEQRAADMDWGWLGNTQRLGITAGASAPELLVDELIAACRERYEVTVEEVRTTEESVVFKLPRQLAD